MYSLMVAFCELLFGRGFATCCEIRLWLRGRRISGGGMLARPIPSFAFSTDSPFLNVTTFLYRDFSEFSEFPIPLPLVFESSPRWLTPDSHDLFKQKCRQQFIFGQINHVLRKTFETLPASVNWC